MATNFSRRILLQGASFLSVRYEIIRAYGGEHLHCSPIGCNVLWFSRHT
jgi:hypothetical protein